MPAGYSPLQERAMQRIRIEKKPVKRKRPHLEILPLDPRDPDVVRAKRLVSQEAKPRPAAAA
jgi:hypothetical protein